MKVYVFSHNALLKPSGGMFLLYRFAEALVKAGYDAKVLIPGNLYPGENPPDYRPSWFHTDIEIVSDIRLIQSGDLVFIHEESLWAWDHLKKNNPRHIMINQGLQHSMNNPNTDYKKALNCYQSALGVIVVSEYIAEGINTIFKIYRDKIHIVSPINIVNNIFRPGLKKNKITIFQKTKEGVSASNDMLVKIVNGRYTGWEIKFLQDVTQKQLSQELSDSKIFLFMCHPSGEGFGIPPIEAALSGCKVIGYSGLGGRSYYKHPVFTEIEYNDIKSFVEALDYWVEGLENKSILEYSDDARQTHQELTYQRDIKLFDNTVQTIMEKILDGQQNV